MAIGSAPQAGKILLAEDDQAMRDLLAFSLFRAGYPVECCRDGLELYQRLEAAEESGDRIDLVISDLRMPALTGLEVLEASHDHRRRPPVICMTAFGDSETHALAARFGALSVIDKPFDLDQLLTRVRELLPLPDSVTSSTTARR